MAVSRPETIRPAREIPDPVNYVMAVFDRAPGPVWLAYFAVAIAAVLVLHIPQWSAGVRPAGTFSLPLIVTAVWSVGSLAARDYIYRSVPGTLRAFRPATVLSDEEADLLARRFGRAPGWPTWACMPAAAILLWGTLRADPTFFGLLTGAPLPDLALLAVGWANSFISLANFWAGAWMLIMVARAQNLIPHIDLSNRRPLFALSGLTIRVALAAALSSYLLSAALPTFASNPVVQGILLAGVVPLSLGAFVLPLWGIHTRMQDEKDTQETLVSLRLKQATATLHAAMDAGDISPMQGLNHLLSSLLLEEAHISKTPTWPWPPGTPSRLLATILLPVILFLTQSVLARVLGL